MPIRIYALAKQLKMDSKELVDICTKAGVAGKGSPLASLSDEELATVNSFIDSAKAARSAGPVRTPSGRMAEAPLPQPVFRREEAVSTGKVPVLPPAPKVEKPKPAEPEQPVEAAPEPEPPKVEVVVPQPVEAPPSEAEPPKVVEPEEVAPPPAAAEVEPAPAAPVRPLFRPATPLGAVPVLRGQRPKTSEKKGDKGPEKERERPLRTIKLAPMPAAAKPSKKAKPSEPAPQKPDMRLPLDAIRASRAGAKPLSEHLKKHEEKRAAAEAAKKGGPRRPVRGEGAAAAGPVAPESTAGSRERVKHKGRGGPVEEKEGVVPAPLGGREQRQLKRKRTSPVKRAGGEEEGDETRVAARRPTHIRRTGSANTAAPRKGRVTVQLPCTVREFCEAVGVPAKRVLGKMLELGTMSNIAASLDAELAEMLSMELGLEVEFRQALALEDSLTTAIDQEEENPDLLKPRPPVITFLGHVDHGKTSLLDRILGLNVAAGEKGGITQHIRAYQIEKDGRKIAFVDTPGHEAFTEMRARGANVTDIAVLVVAADDGVMPQTEEAISHARAAGVPIVVALNKCDLRGVNIDHVYQQLATADLLPTEWGGDTELVKTSAITGEGVDQLLETLLTVAELHEYKANPKRAALGTCLEASLHEGRGVVAKVLVQKGTLHVGDIVVCGPAYGRVKAMYDTLNARKKYKEAGPSMPVHLTGLNVAPGAGDRFHVMEDISKARELAEGREAKARQVELAGARPHVTLETLFERLGQESTVQTLNIIIRADMRGSIEAIRKELTKLEHPEVQIKVLQAAVGGITEADVHLADASDAIVVGFSVVPDEAAKILAEKRGVQIRRYDIIYQLTDDLKAALQGMLKPEKREKDLGRALVQLAYHISRVGTVAGCRVLSGSITRDARMRIIRDSRVIGDYALDSLKREKDDAREVREGMECGIKLANFNDVKEGDVLEAYRIEEVARTL